MSFPFFGDEFTFTQPDGTQLQVRGWGDQNRAVFETLDGFTVTRDPISGFYQYAMPATDGQSLRTTGVRPGAAQPELLSIDPHLRLSRPVARAQAELGSGLPRPRWKERREQARAAAHTLRTAGLLPAPPSRQTVGSYIGLCLLIDFPDVPATISRAEVESFCNQVGYNGFGNAGSVHDYFLDNSAGKLRYTTVVAPYYTARHPRGYYTNPKVNYGERARELIREALEYHLGQGFDFSTLRADDGGYVYATNVFFAGPGVNNWSQGLWPHASRLLTPVALATGRSSYDYQITHMGHELTLGTYCHENGHMLCDFPDLYDYGNESAGVGAFCLMGAGGHADRRNPAQVCAYLKYRAGWTARVTRAAPGQQLTLTAGANEVVIHAKDRWEYFLIENRQRSGRDSALPDSGLAIWHVDETGNNSHEHRTLTHHYECSLIQADGQYDLELGIIPGDSNDLYHADWRDRFSSTTTPASNWWDGSPSGLDVFDIGHDGQQMTFRLDI